ncbi:protein-export membrane protein SecD [Candidatus Gottesmanbacteria bacterium RBG_16_52_11]|uniref:Protein translocase subunit SecD n=1 Tax=Candidatus Gottesmanbacteria bacterium RBG_16_52_11 TaxID=1798374 RepID=A0A1F5YY48_9BACT|nr:MAG: protein-export membrane protein SecD [Candidatus Gottesmanbacteria bacterium RBG_16_52_11]
MRVNFAVGPFKVDRVVNPVSINTTVFGLNIRKEFRTRLGLDLAGGSHIVLNADMKDIPDADRLSALESAKEVIERRVNFFGVAEPVVQSAHTKDTYRIIVELPGVANVEDAVATIGQTARLEFREFTNPSLATEGAMVIPSVQNTKPAGLSGKELKRSELTFSSENGEPQVAVEFTEEGKKLFGEITGRLVGRKLPIFLDQYPVTWPRVNTAITDGKAVITGGFNREQAKMLALQLNAGALPVPVSVIEKRTVDASLGSQSVSLSLRAGVIGLLVVGIFMISRYGKLGILADAALIIYGLITYAIFRWIPVTLTLPGVAGFFLSVGMAVDANILIFERFREELLRGKPFNLAMELGFGKAWDSIRDANITTIVTAIILYNPGNWQFLPSSGLVRGFAATLLIGVLVSLFTGIVVTRTLIRVFYKPGKKGKSN